MLRVALACICSVVAGISQAQTYPAKPVRLVAPYPPGGANDILARIIGPRLGEYLGQQIVIENRGGATGNIGAEFVARAAPDGYTILMGQASNMTINVSLMSRMPFDPIKDFAPVTLVATTPNLLVVHPSFPARTIKDLVALAKAKPGAVNYASSGSGSAGHLAGELFKRVAKIDMVHIPYKGAAPALTDVVAGQAHLYFTSPISATPLVKGGRLRMVAVTSLERSPSLPDIPTVAESGYPDFEVTSWWGILTPAAVSKEIITRLHADILKVLAMPETKTKFADQGADVASNTPAEFSTYIKSEIAKWGKLIKELGVKSE